MRELTEERQKLIFLAGTAAAGVVDAVAVALPGVTESLHRQHRSIRLRWLWRNHPWLKSSR